MSLTDSVCTYSNKIFYQCNIFFAPCLNNRSNIFQCCFYFSTWLNLFIISVSHFEIQFYLNLGADKKDTGNKSYYWSGFLQQLIECIHFAIRIKYMKRKIIISIAFEILNRLEPNWDTVFIVQISCTSSSKIL